MTFVNQCKNMPLEKQPEKPIEAKPVSNPKNGQVVFTEHYEGLIPHPKLMKEWEELVPGSAKSIFTRFENQSDHRIDIEKRVVRAQNFKLYIGPIFAFIIALSAIGGGVWIAITGQPIAGSILSFTGLGTVIAPFLVNELKQEKQDKKDK